MSYCRFGNDSDVYMYHNGEYICCGACRLSPIGYMDMHKTRVMQKPLSALKHLGLHKNYGHRVPKYAIKRLRKEILREAIYEHSSKMHMLGETDATDIDNPYRKELIKQANSYWAIIYDCLDELSML